MGRRDLPCDPTIFTVPAADSSIAGPRARAAVVYHTCPEVATFGVAAAAVGFAHAAARRLRRNQRAPPDVGLTRRPTAVRRKAEESLAHNVATIVPGSRSRGGRQVSERRANDSRSRRLPMFSPTLRPHAMRAVCP